VAAAARVGPRQRVLAVDATRAGSAAARGGVPHAQRRGRDQRRVRRREQRMVWGRGRAVTHPTTTTGALWANSQKMMWRLLLASGRVNLVVDEIMHYILFIKLYHHDGKRINSG
jgi:hypothetical protein